MSTPPRTRWVAGMLVFITHPAAAYPYWRIVQVVDGDLAAVVPDKMRNLPSGPHQGDMAPSVGEVVRAVRLDRVRAKPVADDPVTAAYLRSATSDAGDVDRVVRLVSGGKPFTLADIDPEKRDSVDCALRLAVRGGLLEITNEDDPSLVPNHYRMRRWTDPGEDSGTMADARARCVAALVGPALGATPAAAAGAAWGWTRGAGGNGWLLCPLFVRGGAAVPNADDVRGMIGQGPADDRPFAVRRFVTGEYSDRVYAEDLASARVALGALIGEDLPPLPEADITPREK